MGAVGPSCWVQLLGPALLQLHLGLPPVKAVSHHTLVVVAASAWENMACCFTWHCLYVACMYQLLCSCQSAVQCSQLATYICCGWAVVLLLLT